MSQRWKISDHAKMRLAEMGLGRHDVLTAIKRAEVVYPGSIGHPPGRMIACWSKLAVVFTPATKTIITVLWRGIEFVRPSQLDHLQSGSEGGPGAGISRR